MAGSVGGSGGQMSVSSGGAGEPSAAGGQVDFAASAATAFGVSVIGASEAGFSPGVSPGDVGTVWAQGGDEPFSSGVDSVVLDQSGSPLCWIGSAGRASSDASSTGPVFSAGVTGTVCAQTGVVSRVGTAGTGSLDASGGAESFGEAGSLSKSRSV